MESSVGRGFESLAAPFRFGSAVAIVEYGRRDKERGAKQAEVLEGREETKVGIHSFSFVTSEA